MDKWKDIELEKMKVSNLWQTVELSYFMYFAYIWTFALQAGGNQRAREFLDSQPDYDDSMSIQQKYNTKAAALYRDKISTLAQGKTWSESSSTAQNYSSSTVSTHKHSEARKTSNGQQNETNRNYQEDGEATGGYQNISSPEFRDQKEGFFYRLQDENAARPE